MDLQLGDIIKVYSPSNKDYNEKVFIIDYKDPNIMVILNDIDKYELFIEDNTFTDESIEKIELISRSSKDGYIRQNNIETGDYVNIYFSGSQPYVLNGIVSNIDEDMLEISRIGDEEKFYIDFAYYGIPRDLNIEKIVVKSKYDETTEEKNIDGMLQDKKEQEDKETQDDDVDVDVDTEAEADDDKDITEEIDEDTKEEQNKSIDNDEDYQDDDITEQENIDINGILKKSGDLMFGDFLDVVDQDINVSQQETRYGIDIQTNDMVNTLKLDEKMSKNDEIIKQNVIRFKELREEYSLFNNDGNISGILSFDSNYKPITEKIKHLEQNISWLLPVVEQQIKVYDVAENFEDELEDIQVISNETLNEEIVKLRTPKDFKSTADINGYYMYLQELQKFLIPYVNFDSNKLYGIDITNGAVDTLVDNDGKFGMSSFIDNSIKTHTGGIQRYVSPFIKKEFVEMRNDIETYTRLINNGIIEKMELKSIVTLPKDAVLHERINCNSFSIKDKSNMGFSNFIPSFFIKYNNNKDEHYVTDLNVVNDHKKNIMNMTTNHKLDVFEETNLLNNDSLFEKYFDYIFPTIKEYFHSYKSNMGLAFNMKDIIKELEVFKIEKHHLRFKQYENFFKFITNKTDDYQAAKNERKKQFDNYLRKIQNIIRNPNENSNVEKSLNLILENNDVDKLSLHEKMMMVLEYDNLFHLTIDKNNMNLNSTKNINESLEYFVGKLEKIKSGNTDCDDDFVVAKEYILESKLHDDDNVEIYYDKKFDDTIYELLDVYKKEQMEMEPNEFKTFLYKKLMEVNGLTEERAKYDAETLINKKKLVKDGTYAIFQDIPEVDNPDNDFEIKYLFYKRINNKWVYDSNKTKEHKDDGIIIIENGTNYLCNLKKNCTKTENNCVENTDLTNENKKDLVRRMLGEFEHRFYMEKNELEKFLETNILEKTASKSRVEQLHQLEQEKYVKYFNMLASQYNEEESYEKSPYLDALELIIGIDDFVLKQKQLLRFSNTFTREASQKEDKYWRYCKETNVKLMPTFLHRLAHAFYIGNYGSVLNEIVSDQGKISEDGDAIVDEHSGKIIKYRDLSGDDEYDEKGFRTTREKISDDVENKDGDLGQQVQEELDDESNSFEEIKNKEEELNIYDMDEATIKQRCDEYISILVKRMNVNLKKEIENFVKFYSSMIYIKNFGNNVNGVTGNVMLLLITASVLFIGLQLSRTRNNKSFPGCVVSFEGFPLYEDGDDIGISYMACCISKLSKERRNSQLFSFIKQVNEDKIKQKMKDVIMKFILNNIDIQLKLDEKRKMIKMNSDIVKKIDDFVFLPSLYDSQLKVVKTLTPSFYEDIEKKFNSKNDNVYVYLNRLKSKNIEVGHMFVKIINDMLKKTDLLLTKFDEPYIENTCCVENYIVDNVLSYFNNKDPSLFKYSEMSETNSNLVDNFVNRFRSNVLATKRTQVSIAPFVQTQFDEKTIYTAFIHYCKWNKANNMFSLKGDIYDICSIENDGLFKFNTVDEKIKMLKTSGKQLNNSMLLVLMNKINKMNEVPIESSVVDRNTIELYGEFVSNHEDHHYLSKIKDNVDTLLNNFDISMKKNERLKESFQFVSLMEKEIALIENSIMKFIKEYSFLTDYENRIITGFLKKFHEYEENKTIVFDKDVFMNKINNYKMMVYEITKLFPNLIMNKITHYSKEDSKYNLVPEYWKLSKTHVNDITNINKNYYLWLAKFHDDSNITEIFNDSLESNNIMFAISELTPIFTPKVDGKKVVYTLFDDVLVTSLFKYYILSILDNHIRVMESKNYSIEDIIPVKQNLSTYLKDILVHFVNVKSINNNNYEFVMKKILHFKEKEKLRITEKFEEMNDMEREIENELKNNRLGSKWGKGLEAGLIRYDQEVYERERVEMGEMSEMNDDFNMYVMEEERENNDISFIDDDDEMTSYDNF